LNACKKCGGVGDLTKLKRVIAAVQQREPDRVPVVPQITYAAAHFAGLKFSDGLEDPQTMARSLVEGFRLAGYDGVYVGWESSFDLVAEAMGCELDVKPDEIPVVRERVVKNKKDVKLLQAVDPESSGRIPIHLKAIELVREEIGTDVPIFRYVPGPLTLVSVLMGPDKALTNLIKDPSFIRQALEPATESTLRFAAAAVKHGSDIVVVADPMASSTVISPRMFKEFAYPTLCQVVEMIAEVGGIPSLHICGKTEAILEEMTRTGAKILELDHSVDLAAAKAEVGTRVCIQGNLNPTGVLLTGEPNDVEAESRACIEKASKEGGFILSSGCEIPLNAPLENIKAMVSAAKRFGVYRDVQELENEGE